MKWLFAYDHKFFEKGEDYFSKQGFPYNMWRRYLEHCDQLIVASRIEKLEGNELNYNLSSGNRINFVDIPDASTLAFFMPENASKAKLRQEINKVDGVVARIPSQIGFLAITVAKELNKPYALEIVGDPKESYRFHGSWKAKVYAPLAARTMKKSIINASYSLYITERELQNLYPTKGFEISCSNVELETFVDSNFITKRKENGLPKKIIFGMIGSLDSDYKGLDIAIKALALIKKDMIDFEFRILGSGDITKWQSIVDDFRLRKHVIFCGTKPTEEVFEWLKDINIYLQPSRTEGQGRSVIEAMAMGCLVITSDVGGMKELSDSIMRFPNGDEKYLAKIIQLVLKNPVIYNQQIDRNYQLAKTFSKKKLEEKRRIYYRQFKEEIINNEHE